MADAGAGIVQLGHGKASLVAELPGVTDVAPLGRGGIFAITGGGPDATSGKLWRVSNGSAAQLADMVAFEATVNPDGGVIESNPFDVQALGGGESLVADAAGNALLIADRRGHPDWVAVLPNEVVSTANAKALVGCPTPPPVPELEEVCDLPDLIPTEAVPTSISIGPDGAWYVGELKGFPGPIRESRIWRIEPGSRHAHCGVDPECTVVADGFTSIVDLNFGPDGTLYVTEIDEASFLAIELQVFFGLPDLLAGGTVSACDPSDWTCDELATGLTIPIATTVGKDGTVWAAVNALIPGAAGVIALP